VLSIASPQRICGLLGGAGFSDIDIADQPEPAWLGRDADDAIGFYLSTPFAQQLVAAADERAAARITAALRDALRPYQRDHGVRLGAAAWLATAIWRVEDS